MAEAIFFLFLAVFMIFGAYRLTVFAVKRQRKEMKDLYDQWFQKQEEAIQLLKEIRDLLKDQKKN